MDTGRHIASKAAPEYSKTNPIAYERSASAMVTGGRIASIAAPEYSTTNPTVSPASGLRHSYRQSTFESHLSGLLEEFANIGWSDYKACYAFAKRNPEIWERDERILLRDAFAALSAGKEPHAKRCVQRAVMIQHCTGLAPSKIATFFEGLILNWKSSILEEFLTNCSDAMSRLRAKIPVSAASTSERTISRQDSDSVTGVGSMSPQGSYIRPTVEQRPVDTYSGPLSRGPQEIPAPMSRNSALARRVGENIAFDRMPGPVSRIQKDGYFTRQEPNTAQSRVPGAGAGAGAGAVRERGASDVPTVFVDAEGRAIDTLDGRYKIRASSASFFTVGRVFATPWHTILGASQANFMRQWVVEDCFGQSILTHIQRFVVVKEGRGFSWCVPIFTYAGRGVAKPGLSKTDRLAHAIIYMSGTEPRKTISEADMMEKNPIAVHPATTDQKLDVMSRINFGKVHTVEHNMRVMDVGKISSDDIADFRGYWNEHR